MSKIAVVLFNMGGPDGPKSVRPFLFNLFNDPAIIRLPQPLRYVAASLIAMRRAGKARAIYQHMGGKSPILEQTQLQAEALERQLNTPKKSGGDDYKIFVCMRYTDPRSDVVLKKITAFEPDHVLLLPLYPHYSTTTTASSFDDWDRACKKSGFAVKTTRICCYPTDLGFVAAHANLIRESYWKAAEHGKPRILFSAHGLPEKIAESGDPYQWQVEKTVKAIVQILAIDEVDFAVCYQSRIGPLRWIGPSTEDEIAQAGHDGVPVLVVPISFVSEHSETLVELDVEYRKLADNKSVPGYWRVPALAAEPLFIEALADLCAKADRNQPLVSFTGERFCSKRFNQCPCAAEAA